MVSSEVDKRDGERLTRSRSGSSRRRSCSPRRSCRRRGGARGRCRFRTFVHPMVSVLQVHRSFSPRVVRKRGGSYQTRVAISPKSSRRVCERERERELAGPRVVTGFVVARVRIRSVDEDSRERERENVERGRERERENRQRGELRTSEGEVRASTAGPKRQRVVRGGGSCCCRDRRVKRSRDHASGRSFIYNFRATCDASHHAPTLSLSLFLIALLLVLHRALSPNPRRAKPRAPPKKMISTFSTSRHGSQWTRKGSKVSSSAPSSISKSLGG